MKTIIVNYPAGLAITIKRIWEDTERGNAEILEKVFAWFNHGSGSECDEFLAAKTRSLSVNDFVRIGSQWYQCLSVGWKAVTEEYVEKVEGMVCDHPKLREHGEWYCLDHTMRLLNKLAKAKENLDAANREVTNVETEIKALTNDAN